MAPILVTGGTGTLGRIIVARLIMAGREVRILSRRSRAPDDASPYEWVRGDLRRGEGIDDAVAGARSIIHCASGRGDARAAFNLIGAAKRSGWPDLVYISIVGVDSVPFGYYRTKLEVEHFIEASGLGWTVLRSTQFHDLIARGCQALARPPVMVVPAATSFQPISAGEVADRLVELASGPPAGRVPDMGGPDVRSARDIARIFLDARRRHRVVVPLMLPGRASAGYRRGGHLAPEHAVGRVTFAQFLAERFPRDD